MHPLNRRKFLSLGTRALAGAVVASSAGFLNACQKTSGTVNTLDWKYLSNQLSGTVLLPNQAGFEPFTIPFSLQYKGTVPMAVARCANEKDIVAAIKWAREMGVPLVARSGGHSYAAYSATSGLLLDVSSITDISISSTTGLATIGGGARNQHVYSALRAPSLSVTHGRCKQVGVAGLVLGGGIGFNMRAHGLTCDKLVETKMVTADGSVIVCNEKENADIFWAVRGGGGGNFGVHTSFVFRPFPVGNITVFDMSWQDKVEIVFARLQEVMLAAPDALGAKVWIVSEPVAGMGNRISVKAFGQFAGEQSQLENIFKPVTDLVKPVQSVIQTKYYWDGQELLSEEGEPGYGYERSRFAYGAISAQGQAAIFRNIREWPGTSDSVVWKYFLMGGKIDTLGRSDTAFYARGARLLTSIDMAWKPQDAPKLAANMAWINQFHAEMEQYTSANSYVNFIDRNQENYLNAYYGSNLDKLKAVKKKIDPSNFFNYPQGIPAI